MFKNTLKNWLLKLGVASFTLLIFLYAIFSALGIEYPPISRDMIGDKLSFEWFVVMAVILAPLLEEVAFRGFFTAKRWLRIISFIVLLVFIGLSFSYFALALLVLYIATIFVNDRSGKKHINTLLIMNAVLFAGIHYTAEDFMTSLGTIAILAQFGMGLILLWITINFGLIKAMLFHAFYNGLLMLLLFMALQYPSSKNHRIESENLVVEYKERAILDSNTSSFSSSANKDTLYIHNMSIGKAKPMLEQTNNVEESSIWIENVPFMKYDFKIYTNNQEEVSNYSKELEQLLKQEELIN